MSDPFPDVEGGIRAYLRADPGVQAALGGSQRVFFGIPTTPTWPLIVVAQVGGGDDDSEAPVDRPSIQIDCWGAITPSGTGDKAGATALVNAVRSALKRMRNQTVTPTCRLLGARVESQIWLPDADNDRPRYSVTAEVTAIHP